MTSPVRCLLAAFVLLSLGPASVQGMTKAELIDELANASGLAKAAAERAFDAVVSATTKSVKKGNQVSLVGFGSFSAAKHSAFADPKGATGLKGVKKTKLQYRGGRGRAGVLTRGPAGTFEFELGLPDASFLDDPLQIELKLPKPFDPRPVHMDIGLPGGNFADLLSEPDAFPMVIQVSLPTNGFDDPEEEPNGPVVVNTVASSLDFYGEFFASLHFDDPVDPCDEIVLSERLGLGAELLCVPGSCGVGEPELDLLASEVAVQAEIDPVQARLFIDAMKTLPFEQPPGGTRSVSGFGSFTVKKRPARSGRNPQTGQAIKIPAKKTVKFKPGKVLKEILN